MRQLVTLAAVAVIAVLLWLWLPTRTPAPELDAPPPAHEPAPNTIPANAAVSDPVATSSPSERQAVPPVTTPPSSSPSSSDDVAVRGRCVAAETGTPLAGCRVRLHGFARGPETRGKSDYKSPAQVVTGADGRFEIRTKPPATHEFMLDAGADGRSTLRQNWKPLPPQGVDVGDVPLVLGAILIGRLLDEAGVPVGSGRISLNCPEIREARTTSLYTKEFSNAGSSPDGTLYTDQALAPGRWTVRIDRDHKLVRPSELVVAGGQRELRTDIVVQHAESLPQISGTVVDEGGRPMAGVTVHASAEAMPFGGGGRGSRAGADGRFTLRRSEASGDKAHLTVGPEGGFLLAGEPQLVPWGTKDVRVVVKAPLSLRLRVVEAESGRPVPDYAVRCIPQDGNVFTSSDRELREGGHHEDGVVVIPNVRPGRNRVIVYPESAELVTNSPVDLLVTPGTTDHRVELPRRDALTVHVRLQGGKPAAHSRLELLRNDGPGKLDLCTFAGPIDKAHSQFWSTGAMGVVLATATTGADGRAVLLGPVTGDLYVKALGPGHAPLMRGDVTIAKGGSSLELTVERGATIQGRVIPAQLLAKLKLTEADLAHAQRAGETAAALGTYALQISLHEVDGTRVIPPQATGGLRLAADGSFAFEGVPKGDWRVRLQVDRRSGAFSSQHPELPRVNGVLDGETRTIEVDASSLLPGTIAGRILLDGQPYGDQQARFGGAQFATDAQGAFVVEVPPGEHRLTLLPGDSSRNAGRGSILHEDSIDVRSGEKLERSFAVQRRRAKIRVLEADGTPVRERHVTLGGGNVYVDDAPIDRDGWVVVDPAPPDAIWVGTWPRGMTANAARAQGGDVSFQALQIKLGECQIPAGQREATFELRVPAGK